jgi:hypothetical protein
MFDGRQVRRVIEAIQTRLRGSSSSLTLPLPLTAAFHRSDHESFASVHSHISLDCSSHGDPRLIADIELLPSGGWLGEMTVVISEVSGMSDILIFWGLGTLSWIILRTSYSEISIILALGFDLVIPMQYHSELVYQRPSGLDHVSPSGHTIIEKLMEE